MSTTKNVFWTEEQAVITLSMSTKGSQSCDTRFHEGLKCAKEPCSDAAIVAPAATVAFRKSLSVVLELESAIDFALRSCEEKSLVKVLRRLSKILKEAKVKSVYQLKGIPVEVTFEGNLIKEWRILTEVL